MTPVRKATKLDGLERVEFMSRAQWRAWLQKHHTRTEGIWLVHWKKATPDKHIGYAAIVEEALCFGWIDSLPRKLDAERTMLYLSPRKPKSVWSKMNKERVARLMAEGHMAKAGLRKVKAAKADGSWSALDAVEAMEVPADLANALARRPAAGRHFHAFTPGARKLLLAWIGSARTAATRTERIRRTVESAAQNMRAYPNS
jgi:uncharacterized protein YdeI (YjbR/CyaY-like superfamily)